MNRRHALAAISLGVSLCLSCGGEARTPAPQASAGAAGNASAPDGLASGGANAQGGACGREPRDHRAQAQACPSERGSAEPLDMTACMNRIGITCTKDADCTAGLNGRCIPHNEPCDTACSYDECLKDSDCPTGPCLCRPDGAATTSNQCSPSSNCKTDAECGNCGYCSPDSTPSGLSCTVAAPIYSCHTPSDQCVDQSDCDGRYCAFDSTAARWACASCGPVPHPK